MAVGKREGRRNALPLLSRIHADGVAPRLRKSTPDGSTVSIRMVFPMIDDRAREDGWHFRDVGKTNQFQ